jgi:hypothetical protein
MRQTGQRAKLVHEGLGRGDADLHPGQDRQAWSLSRAMDDCGTLTSDTTVGLARA